MEATGAGGVAETPDTPARGTWLAVTYALVAVAVVGTWGFTAGRGGTLTPFLFACLLATALLAERIALPLSARGWYTVSTPIVLLTGLLGGPVVGALAGVATALGDTEAAWRRRLTFGGLDALRGFAAGLAGLLPLAGSTGAAIRAAAAVAAALALNSIGRAFIHRARRIDQRAAYRRGTVADVLEAVAAVPLLALLVQSHSASGSTLVILTLAGLLLALGLAAAAARRSRARLETERRLARTDPLTDAVNRRGLDEELERVHGRVARGERAAGFVVLDLDFFKQVNGEHGWEGGDAVLRGVVERLREGMRDADVIARRGGEEFAVVAPGIDSESALRRAAEKTRLLVRSAPFDLGGVERRITVSVGAALLDGSVTPEIVERRANHALAVAKERRDCAVTWDARATPRPTPTPPVYSYT
jgi:diguanylate cyclase (GGDEF)-like protein